MELVNQKTDKLVLGVHLLHEKTREPCLLFGAIIITAFKIHTLTVRECRNILKLQLSGIPNSFKICTAEKCPLREDQEDLLLLKDIIKSEQKLFIIREFEKPKCGIIVNSGDSLSNMGFIFADYNCSLTDLRPMVVTKLEDKGYLEDFEFLDMNGWPVHREIEYRLLVMDILNDNVIVVQSKFERRNSILSCDLNSSLNIFRKKRKWNEDESDSLPPISHEDSASSFLEKSMNACNKSNGFTESKNQTPKQILISYCRAEAARHALVLKEELSKQGFTVYLDVHEIKSGYDWQDSLNYAVSNCEVFVPLVTPRYGQTQWTNREVKLADILGKSILPVSFLTEWPPRCLAIQFATTQFIRWKTKAQINTEIAEGKGETCHDISLWDQKYVTYVASDIGERINAMRKELLYNLGTSPSLVKRKTIVRSLAAKVQSEILTDTFAVTEDREGRPLILICLHPEQSELGTSVKNWLEGKKYEVWLTTEVQSWESETVPATPTLSQDVFSQMAFDVEDGSKDVMEKQKFQEKADEANVILAVLSASFSKSATCKQQLFYCEHRKRVIFLKQEDFRVPGWMKMLIGSSAVENVQSKDFFTSLDRRLKKVLDPEDRESPQEEIDQARINTAVKSLKKNLPTGFSVFVCGCQVIRDPRIETICRILGEQLALVDDLTMITGGCDGVEEIISSVYYEKLIDGPKHRLWHVLPMRGMKPKKSESTQSSASSSSSFCSLPYGKTLFCGGNPKERDLIVSQAFDVAIIVEGDSSTICTAEQFIWNDHIVIPVQCFEKSVWDTGSIQEKAFQIPQGISETDWSELNCLDSTPELICESVIRILKSLLERQEKVQEKTRLVTRVCSVPNDPEKSLLKTEPTLKPILKKLQPDRRSSLNTMRTVILK